MTRVLCLSVLLSLFSSPFMYAETPGETPVESTPTAAADTPQEPAPSDESAEPALDETATGVSETEPADSFDAQNLEFVSGEVSALDESAKSLTIKLYGETEESASDKLLTVQVEETTDITDGEKDREMKSLAAGTEVDVEYDPATKKATYIFVY